MKIRGWVLGVAVVGGVCLWVADAVLDAFVFYEGTFWELLIFDIPPHEIYIRLLFLAFFLLFGLLMSVVLQRHRDARRALHRSEKRLRVLMETASQGIVLVNQKGTILMVNAMTEEMFGYSRESLVGQPLEMLVPVFVRDRHNDLCAGFFEAPRMRPMGIGLDLTARRHDGHEFPVEISLSFVETSEGSVAMALLTDITGRKRAADALVARTEELDAFAHTVAHDLKGPLSQMIGFAKVLMSEDEELPADDRHLALRSIESSAYKMVNIVDELLLLASVRQEDVQLEPIDMAAIVEGALSRVRHLAERHDAEFVVPETWPVVRGYAAWVEEVWANYLSNAIKYGGRPPRIELDADMSEGSVRYWVRDNGAGIPPEEQARLFTPFARLDSVRAKGQGLGLSIVRRIVERLGGEVGVDSIPGEGSTFWFTLLT